MHPSPDLLSSFNTFDGVVLVIILVCGVFGFLRGFISEILGIFSIILAFCLSQSMLPFCEPWVGTYIKSEKLAHIATSIGLFFILLVLLKTVSRALAGGIRSSFLSSADRTLGMPIGVLKGFMLVSLGFWATGFIWYADDRPLFLKTARSMLILEEGASVMEAYLIPDFIVMARKEEHDAGEESMKGSMTPKLSAIDALNKLQEVDHLVTSLSSPQPKTEQGENNKGYSDTYRKEMQRLVNNMTKQK